MVLTSAHAFVELDSTVLNRMNRQGPRYTSYPTADRFTPGFGLDDYLDAVTSSRSSDAVRPLSLYVHIPFCESLCYYCACNKIITKDHDKARVYLEYLAREIDMQAALFSQRDQVEQMHFGGGTPTYLSHEQMTALVSNLRNKFNFVDESEGEFSIEIDPRTVDEARIHQLRDLGFNRLSMGVQDFEEEVQRAVNRIQPEIQTLTAIRAARDAGFLSVSIDLIYGLPKQTLETMERTISKVIAASPDRISIYSYAHMPQLFKSQGLMADTDLPSPEVKLQMLGYCIAALTDAGYIYIGMDHFAKPEDGLSRALAEGRLHRNFQGYSTHAEAEILALGVSGISGIGGTYSQNEKSLKKYYARLDEGVIPVARGIRLSEDDKLRRTLIQMLACHFRIDKLAIEREFGLDFDSHFSQELDKLEEMERDGFVVRTQGSIEVTERGRLVVRVICMVFDRYLGQPRAETLTRMPYSKTI